MTRREFLRATAAGVTLAGCGRAEAAPTVVLLVADTLRADHVTPEMMPTVTALARESTTYSRCWATSSWTLPSHRSLFSGRLPVEGFDSAPTIAERLRDKGYDTAGVVANSLFVTAKHGMDRGFGLWVHPGKAGEVTYREVAAKTEDAVARTAGPLFLFLNLMDTHFPYTSGDRIDLAKVWPFREDGSRLNAAVAQRMRDGYKDGVQAADAGIGKVIDILRKYGRWQNTVFAFTSDHGEYLGEHNKWMHPIDVHEQTVRVPLVVRYPGRPAKTEMREVSSCDVPNLLLTAVGLEPLASRRPVMCGLYNMERPRHAALEWPYKLRRTPEGDELYDLEQDAGETVDCRAEAPTVYARLARQLDNIPADGEIEPAEMDSGEQESLRSLGYL